MSRGGALPGGGRRASAVLGIVVAGVLLLAGCAGTSGSESTDEPAPSHSHGEESPGADHQGHDGNQTKTPLLPLRPGETRLTMSMPEPYTPSPPTGVGTDDYRCFLLDPHLAEDMFLTGTSVQPGNSDVVHHVILFRVPPDQVEKAQLYDDATPGEGWTCFGNAGLGGSAELDNAPWLGAWAPGGTETVFRKGLGVALDKGSRIVMQVHYNLLVDDSPDVSATQLRLAPVSAKLEPVETLLMPAAVELPCRPGHTGSPLCDRDAAVADVKARFGEAAGSTADLLHLLCGEDASKPGQVQSCTRHIQEPTTVVGVAGHMHLLGRSIKIEVNPGTPQSRTILDIPVWDFDNQGAKPIKPVHLDPFDTVKVTCRHVQWLRDKLPSFEGQPDRFVVWGEGSTDEMCLGILQVTRP